ncbi:bifunctional diguanylate cyclase/phosphodiesterase [Vibrio sp. DNF-1]|nr:bifunctional diguanylate cyclase/phosphodiesterase [Vibrio salinus]MCE0494900.1 bifunctional diguanylate cyclase/phosphodiesterase [Vibrio salinus]
MMATVLFVLIEKDLFILRHIVRLVIFVDLFNVLFSSLAAKSLQSSGIINPHNTSSSLFDISIPFITLGGVLIIFELLSLLFIFEKLKKININPIFTAILYIIAFIAILCFDGIAFPLIAFGFSPEIVTIVFGGLDGKILTAAFFSIPLLLFALIKRQSFIYYLESDHFRWKLLFKTSSQLMEEMTEKEYSLDQAATVFKNSNYGLAFVNNSGHILQANQSFTKMLKLCHDDVTNGKSVITSLFQHNGLLINHSQVLSDKWRGEVTFGEKFRHQGLLSVTKVMSETEKQATYVFSLVNIDEQKNIQKKLNHLALHDQLTQLPNRRVLDDKLSSLEGQPASLLLIDLDHFKDVNDSYGHTSGDKVLKEIATRLLLIQNEYVKNSGCLCRTGGDEFALLIQSYDIEITKEIIKSVQEKLRKAIVLDNHTEVYISATIGVSFQSIGKTRDLLQEADAGLYEAKRNQRGSYGIYEDRLTRESQRKLTLSSKLKVALENDALEVYYQPQYDPKTEKPVALEALARWNDRELGWVSPEEFILVAEETGLIEKLGSYVLRTACLNGCEWTEKGFSELKISVNVSAYQVRLGRFITRLENILKQTNYPPHLLELELTESGYIEREKEVLPVLEKIKTLGIGLAIDDFGTGYSSLSYLSKMPWDTLKIDRSFVSDIPENPEQCQLTSTIIQMAHALKLNIVVEGVETKEQLDFVSGKGCQLIQGYYYSRPLPKAKITALLKANPAHSGS